MKVTLATIVFFFGIVTLSFSQNKKLKDAKESLKDNSTSTSTSSSGSSTTTTTTTSNSRRSRRSRRSSANFDSGNPFLDIATAIALNLTYGIVVESVFERESQMHFAQLSLPNQYGNFVYADSSNYALARLDLSNNFLIESKNLYGNTLNLNFRFKKRFDIEAGYLQLLERNNGQTEGFALFTTLLNYHRIRTQTVDFWFGLGAMYVANDVKEFGFAYGAGVELFIVKPISILASYKGSSINSREVSKSKIILNYHLKKYSISTGYEHFVLGVSKVNTFSLGFRLSF